MDDERGAISTATQMAKLTPGRMVGVIGIAHDGTAINLSLTYSRDQGILVVDNLA